MTQEYVGTKIVTAWFLEKEGQPGYAVKYSDGYTSWSPSAVFEEAYLPLGNISSFAPHVQRLIAEYVSLTARFDKLDAFIGGADFATNIADPVEAADLRMQASAMRTYIGILQRRIARTGVYAGEAFSVSTESSELAKHFAGKPRLYPRGERPEFFHIDEAPFYSDKLPIHREGLHRQEILQVPSTVTKDPETGAITVECGNYSETASLTRCHDHSVGSDSSSSGDSGGSSASD